MVLDRNVEELLWYKDYHHFLLADGEVKRKITVIGIEEDGTRLGFNIVGLHRVLHLEAPTTQMKRTWLHFLNMILKQSLTMKKPSALGTVLFRVLTDQMDSSSDESLDQDAEFVWPHYLNHRQ